MEQQLCRYGRAFLPAKRMKKASGKKKKGFLFITFTSVILLMLMLMLILFTEVNSPESNPLIQASTLRSAYSSVRQDIQQITRARVYNNLTHCKITEDYFPSKSADISAKLGQYSGFLQIFANKSNYGSTFSYAYFASNEKNLVGDTFNYTWNAAYSQLVIKGSYNALRVDYNRTAVITENCNNLGAVDLHIQAGAAFTDNPSADCAISLNFSGQVLPITYTAAANSLQLDYSAVTYHLQQNSTIQTSNQQQPRYIGNLTAASTASTTNPGWTEPTYPSTAGAVKHYGSANLAGQAVNVIVVDSDNNTAYDSAYLDTNSNSNFSDAADVQLAQDQSHMFLNSRVFLITITANGNSVKFNDQLGMRVQKLTDELISSF